MKKAKVNKKTASKTTTKPTKARRRRRKELELDLPELSLFARMQREKLGYTQEQLAFRSGLNLRFIREFELGKKTARLDKVMHLFDFLGADLKIDVRKLS